MQLIGHLYTCLEPFASAMNRVIYSHLHEFSRDLFMQCCVKLIDAETTYTCELYLLQVNPLVLDRETLKVINLERYL